MIHELTWFTLLFVLVLCVVWWLAEDETLREYSERRAINALADESRKRKPVKRVCKYSKAG